MTTYSVSEFKIGLKILIHNQPCEMVAREFVKPGKGQAFMRVKLKNLLDGRVFERTYKSRETVTAANVVALKLQYLYADGSSWHFMEQTNFEQYSVEKEVISRSCAWIREKDICSGLLHDGKLVAIEPPNFVDLEVVQVVPGNKGNTASGGAKPATLENGVVIKAPQFITVGDKVRVDTRTNEYVSRSKQ